MREYPIRNTLLLLIDITILLAGFYSAVFVLARVQALEPDYMAKIATIIPVLVLAAAITVLENGLINLKRMSFSHMVISTVVSVLQVLLIMVTVNFFLPESISYMAYFLAAGFQATGLILWKSFLLRLESNYRESKNVLVVGNPEECSHISEKLSAEYFRHYNLWYLRETELTANVRKKIAGMDLVILAESMNPARKDALLNYIYSKGLEVIIVPSFNEIIYLDAQFDRFEDVPVFRMRKMRPTAETMFIKRCLDLAVAVPALVFFFPLMAAVALAIRMESEGPAIYRQTRVGQRGKTFEIYKFRSMYQDAEKHTGPVLATCSDPRVTRVGRFLRASRLDELPQLINVVLGQMSLVGPRPERPVFVDQYKRALPAYRFRHNVKPGITGLAQVYGRYNTDAKDKLVYDLLYIQKCSLISDLDILFRTVKILFLKESTEGVAQQPRMIPIVEEPKGEVV